MGYNERERISLEIALLKQKMFSWWEVGKGKYRVGALPGARS